MTVQPFQERIARKYPANYRQEIIPDIIDLITKGESCFIVGVSGISKSNLFRCIWNRETRDRYLTNQNKAIAFVWADTNGLAGELSAFYLYELILYNLQKWVEENDRPEVSTSFFQELHEKVVSSSENRTLAQRHLESALRYLFNRIEGFHLVLLFDEFEPIAKVLDIQFFRNLRWLRDEFKYHLSYIMAAHRTPIAIREEFFDEGESLYELLASNILGLKPYNPDDTRFMISELSRRYEAKIDANKSEIVLQLSGGHGGLIAALFKILLNSSLPYSEAAQIEQLLSQDSIAGECRKIWNSLEKKEQDVLFHLVKKNFALGSPLKQRGLITKGVITKEAPDQISMFSPLFQAFLQTTFEQVKSLEAEG